MKKIFFISNGHGEDLVAKQLIAQLEKDFACTFFPLVKERLPSGGFSLRNINFLTKDLAAGLFGHTLGSFNQLRSFRGKFDLVVAIGDIVPLLGARLVRAPFVFVGVNKSSYYKTFGYNYTPWEKLMLRRAKKVFVRDKRTEIDLTSHGIKIKGAEYVGNPLMDCVGKMTNDECIMTNEGTFTIGLLPGTRDDAKLNLEDFQKVAEELIKTNKSPDFSLRFLIATTLIPLPDYVENKPFAEVLSQSDLIIGLSGTGNEQAAGMGLPVVAFYGRGSQYNRRFADAQKELLGEALSLIRDIDPLCVASEVCALLRWPQKRAEMGRIGRERMGEPGAIDKIVAYIRRTI